MDEHLPQPPRSSEQHDLLLRAIALLKFVKSVLLLTAGGVALELHQPSIKSSLELWASAVADHYHIPLLTGFMRKISGLHGWQATGLAAACFAYAALFLTEGVGLWRDRRWAEYLTVIATGSLLPLEVYELVEKLTWLRVATFVVNGLILAYLIHRLMERRRGGRQPD